MPELSLDYMRLRGAFLKVADHIRNSPEGKELFRSLIEAGQSPTKATINTLQGLVGASSDIEQMEPVFDLWIVGAIYKIQFRASGMAFIDYIDHTSNKFTLPEAEEKLRYLREYLSDKTEYRAIIIE